jgi:uncharacterized protein
MATLIDGYNLMHAAGMLGRNRGPGSLQRARAALFRFLAAALPEPERNATTVVFDAPAASPGLPGDEEFQGIRVRYAVGYDSADSLMAELIRKDPAPRRLVVVSGDREVQRSARRRRAAAIDSERWVEQLRRQRQNPTDTESDADHKPTAPMTEAEIDAWIDAFGER